MYLLLKMVVVHCYVSLPEGNSLYAFNQDWGHRISKAAQLGTNQGACRSLVRHRPYGAICLGQNFVGRIHKAPYSNTIYDIKWYALRENICKSLIIQKEYIVQCLSTGVSFSILFPMQKPVHFDWISWSFRFQVAGFIQSSSLPPTKVWLERGEGQQEDVMMDLLDFVRMMWVKLGLWNPQFSKNHLTWWLHHGNGKKLIAGISYHPSRLKWLNKNPGEMADTIVSIGKCAYSYCIFAPFLFLKRHCVKWWSHGCENSKKD